MKKRETFRIAKSNIAHKDRAIDYIRENREMKI